MSTRKEDNDAERWARVDSILEQTAALRERAKKARRQTVVVSSRLQDQLHTMWQSVALRCVLVSLEDEVFAVQLLDSGRAILTERCRDADEAAIIAERLWEDFVEQP